MISELLNIGRQFEFVMAIMLLIFAIASFILCITTISNAIRLRNVLIQWKEINFGGIPLFATMFLILSIALFSLAYIKGAAEYYLVTSGYLFISLNWVISSYLMSKKYITDNGIVKNINDPSQTIVWPFIQDYLEYEYEGGYTYVFMYSKNGIRRKVVDYFRIELHVPQSKLYEFNKILHHKLGRRFHHPETLDQLSKVMNPRKKN